jgi:hypothetical protein
VTIHAVEQGTPEWLALRAPMLTASCAGDMLATLKGKGEAAARRDLRLRLVCARLTGTSQDSVFPNAEMQRGKDCEPLARADYEAATGYLVQPVGFISHDTLLAGYSPDGVIDDGAGLLEIKCPKTATHIGWLEAGVIPPQHMPQLLHGLWITGADWIDFVSWDDRLPVELKMFTVRLDATDPAVRLAVIDYGRSATAFLAEVDAKLIEIEAMREKRGKAAA